MKNIFTLILFLFLSVIIGALQRNCLVEIESPENGSNYSEVEPLLFKAKINEFNKTWCGEVINEYVMVKALIEKWNGDDWEMTYEEVFEPEGWPDDLKESSWSREIVPRDINLSPGEYRFSIEIEFWHSIVSKPLCTGTHENFTTFYIE